MGSNPTVTAITAGFTPWLRRRNQHNFPLQMTPPFNTPEPVDPQPVTTEPALEPEVPDVIVWDDPPEPLEQQITSEPEGP
jgi:hypothetical protein